MTFLCVLAIGLSVATPASTASESTSGAVIADVVVVRPGCLVATAIGSAFFIVSLPVALISRSVKKTAHTLVVKPAKATFTRPLGDLDALDFSD
jgi:hypothetical protein